VLGLFQWQVMGGEAAELERVAAVGDYRHEVVDPALEVGLATAGSFCSPAEQTGSVHAHADTGFAGHGGRPRGNGQGRTPRPSRLGFWLFGRRTQERFYQTSVGWLI